MSTVTVLRGGVLMGIEFFFLETCCTRVGKQLAGQRSASLPGSVFYDQVKRSVAD
ncbi:MULTISPECIES: hypothetical protein [unclassified Pseudomonas]|uniref:hypothetical protein n=1 Tax=unclassified Pseudomonas TaxID=196821 RepID=UPI001B3232B5|nr:MULTISPECIES: hypothetical protein [unclassified Pseudomonas]MBP5945932.1 hypothetical protein [Pseudomonas sp. P9(2020)]MBZ9564072.1 hypothetical protein [Pseudomonas sp. P116]